MYQRKRKNDFYKKVEQMIAGWEKRSYIDTTNINNNNNNGGTTNINDNNNISDISNDNNNGGITNINDNSNISDTTKSLTTTATTSATLAMTTEISVRLTAVLITIKLFWQDGLMSTRKSKVFANLRISRTSNY